MISVVTYNEEREPLQVTSLGEEAFTFFEEEEFFPEETYRVKDILNARPPFLRELPLTEEVHFLRWREE